LSFLLFFGASLSLNKKTTDQTKQNNQPSQTPLTDVVRNTSNVDNFFQRRDKEFVADNGKSYEHVHDTKYVQHHSATFFSFPSECFLWVIGQQGIAFGECRGILCQLTAVMFVFQFDLTGGQGSGGRYFIPRDG